MPPVVFLTVIFLNCHFLLAGQKISGIRLQPYLQEIKTEVQLPAQAGKNVVKLFRNANSLVAVTSNGVFRLRDGTWEGKPSGTDWRTATIGIKGEIWLASVHSIQKEGDTKIIELPDFARHDTILCLRSEDSKSIQVGTTNGLLTYDGTWNSIPFTSGKRVNAVVKDPRNDLWVATTDGLLRLTAGKWIDMDKSLMAAGLKRTYFSLQSNNKKAEVIFGGLVSVGSIAENGENWLLKGNDGLPYGPVTTIRVVENCLWLGTGRGAIKKDSLWHYYSGKRWLNNDKVNDILPVDSHTTWIASPEGISQIQEIKMTLAQKADYFEQRIQKRHERYGLVSPSRLIIPGDLSSNQTTNNDNDGLWTSIYLAAECYRFSVTKDPEAKINALRTFEALERLETVTGIPGLPARSFARANDTIVKSRSPYPKEWHLSGDGKWKWLDDASSDEIVGHMFAIPLFYNLVAEGEMKEKVKKLIDRIMTHIVDNNFQLIDFDGKPTQWAIWTPDSLNVSPFRWYERGLNSLQILSFLKTAYNITNNQKFEIAYQTLIQQHHYLENIVQAKMYEPFENSHSDDILTYLPFYNIFQYTKDEQLLSFCSNSLNRAWKVARPDRIPLWNIIAGTAFNKECDLEISLNELQQLPMDLINWTMTNSHRWDLPADQLTDRSGARQSTKPIPIAEGAISKWNSNTRRYDSGNNGSTEDDGAYFLLPYWMGRYHGFFTEK